MKLVPNQVWLLMFAYALMMAGTSLMVLIAGIIGTASEQTAAIKMNSYTFNLILQTSYRLKAILFYGNLYVYTVENIHAQ